MPSLVLSARSCGRFALSFPDITCMGRTVTLNLEEVSLDLALFPLSVEPQWSLLVLLTLLQTAVTSLKTWNSTSFAPKFFFQVKPTRN